ncbi:MAG: ABC transporter ATP-binding protein [Myxococcales bacterium]|nr:ABC transporter ATP-binding protein [Myxococcales bacterium]
MGFRLVVSILWRCVGLLHPVRWHVVALSVGFSLVAMLMLPSILILFDLFWARALRGEPLTLSTALAMSLDPDIAVHVEILGQEVRRQIARQAMLLGVGVFGTLIPIGIGLWYYQVWILQRVNQTLRIELLDRLQNLSLRFHSDHPVGDTIYRLYQDTAMVTHLIDVLFLTPLFATSRFAFGLIALAAFDPRLSLLLALTWIPTLLIGGYFSRPLRVGFRQAREANSRLTSRIQETLAGIRIVKAYGAERREQERFEASSREAFDQALDARSKLAVFGVVVFWVLGLLLIVTAGWTAEMTRERLPLYAGAAMAAAGLGTWNLGSYNAFKFLIGWGGTEQIRLLLKTWGRTQDIAIGLDRVFELLDLEPEVVDEPGAVALPKIERGIAFHQVRFRYQPDRAAIEGVSFEARIGTVTAIVGPTGSGKSTLMTLLLRLFDPDTGRIEVDGVDVRRFTVASLRKRVAIALQENVLFGTTIRENIRYAVPDASDERVRAAARLACADDYIEALPDQYDTKLGERGAKLSTGQRQRLSIARAVLKAPDVLLLDEPTASLDASTEARVLRNLTEWGRDRAIFIITHRLSTIRQADRIVVIRDGRLVESGSHDELMSLDGGFYRRMVDSEVGVAPHEPQRASL